MTTTASTITSSRLVRLAFAEPRHTRDRNARRARVAAHVESWMDAGIVSEKHGGGRCTLVIALARRVSLAAAEAFAVECPHYVKGSCELLED